MNCMFCTSGVSSGFFATLFNTQLSVTVFYSVLMCLVIGGVFAAYRIGIAYTRLTEREVNEARAALKGLAESPRIR